MDNYANVITISWPFFLSRIKYIILKLELFTRLETYFHGEEVHEERRWLSGRPACRGAGDPRQIEISPKIVSGGCSRKKNQSGAARN